MDDWTTDELQEQVAGLVLTFLNLPGQMEVTTITDPHSYAMQRVSEHIRCSGPIQDQEVLQRIVENAVYDLLLHQHKVLNLIDCGAAYDESITEHDRQWSIEKGMAEKPRNLITDAEFVGPGHSLDLSKMKPYFRLTDNGKECKHWLWKRISNFW